MTTIITFGARYYLSTDPPCDESVPVFKITKNKQMHIIHHLHSDTCGSGKQLGTASLGARLMDWGDAESNIKQHRHRRKMYERAGDKRAPTPQTVASHSARSSEIISLGVLSDKKPP